MNSRLCAALSLSLGLGQGLIHGGAAADEGLEASSAGRRVVVGPPEAYAAMPALDQQRSRTTLTVLGRAPHVSARIRLADGIAQGLAVSRTGTLVVIHSGVRLSELDAGGRPIFSLTLPGEPSSVPVITSNELRAVVVDHELWGIARDGRVRFRAQLSPGSGAPRPARLLSTSAGGVVVATGNKISSVSAFGTVTAAITLPDAVAELMQVGDGLVAVTDSGTLFAIDALFSARRIGSLGGPALAVASNHSARTLLARTGPERLVAFDSGSGETRALPLEPGLTLDGVVLLTPESRATAFENDGSIVGFEPDGGVQRRVSLAFTGLGAASASSVLLLGDGSLLLIGPGRDAWLVTSRGAPLRVEDSACPDPLGLYPAGPSRVVIACRSGALLWLE